MSRRKGLHKFHLGRKYVAERFYPPETFHPASFRLISSGGYKFTVGVPKQALKTDGFMPLEKGGRFTVGTRVQRMLHPVGKFKRSYPKVFKKLQASTTKTVTAPSTHIPKYGLVAGM
jgi:hypothetical protein